MSIVKIRDKRIGVTYVYQQEKGKWDPVRKQTRNKRTLIGKVDPVTGETVPTKGWGKNRTAKRIERDGKDFKQLCDEQEKLIEELNHEIAARDLRIAMLEQEIQDLKKNK